MSKKSEKQNKQKKKFHLSTLIFVLCLIAGLCLLLYPTVSDLYNQYKAGQTIRSYKNQMQKLSPQKSAKLWKQAKAYNRALAKRGQNFQLSKQEREKYYKTLNPNGDGIMGYIVIHKLKENIPIYHGTSEKVLQIGSGHIDWTSLPVGGENSLSVLSGHRGLPSARLFTDLDKVKRGDKVVLHVLNHTLTYKVDEIKVILPTQPKSLYIRPGQDGLTLMTCTPYGVNTHRLLVHGHRVPNDKVSAKDASPSKKPLWILIAAAAGTAFLIFLLYRIKHRNRKKKSAVRS
jgi:sortase A